MPRLSRSAPTKLARGARGKGPSLPGQVVLVLQGGGALGAYQIGVYEALHEAGIEPDWVIGTSIGAINGAIIAGNAPRHRAERLRAFWASVEQRAGDGWPDLVPGLGNVFANLVTMAHGVPTFFTPNPAAWFGQHTPLGIEGAAYYTTEPLRETLAQLVDFGYINGKHVRLTVGAVNVNNGEMRYFDSRDEDICLEHVMASGALPPAFPAVRVDGAPYWDGGIYSNTPIEAVLDDKPRKDSVIFAVQMWNPEGTEPATLWEVAGRRRTSSTRVARRAISRGRSRSTTFATSSASSQSMSPKRRAIRQRSRSSPPGAAARRCMLLGSTPRDSTARIS